MTRFRMIVGSIVAVAMLSFGAAACTPADRVQFQSNGENLFALILFQIYVSIFCQNNNPCLP